MNGSTRRLLLALGALWGFAMALVPVLVAFDGPLNPSPFLVSAFVCAALSGAAGTLVAGWKSARTRRSVEPAERPDGPGEPGGTARRVLSRAGIGLLQTVVAGGLAALSIWLALTVTMTGFSTATPTEFFNLFSRPELFLQSAIVGQVVLLYALVAGAVLAPVTGTFIVWLVRRGRVQTG